MFIRPLLLIQSWGQISFIGHFTIFLAPPIIISPISKWGTRRGFEPILTNKIKRFLQTTIKS